MAKNRSKPFVIPEILRDFLTSHFQPKDRLIHVLVAVSGGADSMALLAAAQKLREMGELHLSAAHLIHHPESEEAVTRAKMVDAYCKEREIPHFMDKISPQELNDKTRSPEERMRQARYRFLERVAEGQKCDVIMTGHHANDQAETVLHRVITGTGMRGLMGIPPQRGNILRPFLSLNKSDLLAYCMESKVPYASDPSNLELDSPRNFIRHSLMPTIEKQLNPNAVGALCRLSWRALETEEVVNDAVQKCWKKTVLNFQKSKIVLDIRALLTYFTLIQKFTIHRAIVSVAGFDLQLTAADLDRIVEFLRDSRTGSFLEFQGDVRLVRDRESLIITKDSVSPFSRKLIPGEDQEIPELSVQAIWSKPGSKALLVGDGLRADMHFSRGSGDLIFRYALEKDRFFPLGSTGEKRLFRFLTDRKVSRFDKRTTPVLTQGGDIIWVVGHRISQKVRVQDHSDGTWRLSLIPSSDEEIG